MPDIRFKNLTDFLTALRRKRVTTVAGAWVYYFLLSFVPLVFIIVAGFSLFGVDVSAEIVAKLPAEFKVAGETIIEAAERVSSGITVFFVGTVIFSVTTLLNQMSKDGDYIYGAKSVKKRGIFRRLWACFALLIFFVAILFAAVAVAFYNVLFGARHHNGLSVLATVLTFTLIIAVSYVIILFLNKFICPFKLKVKDGLLGSLVSLFIIVLGTIGFILYLKFFANYNAFYGSLSTVVVFMLWAYILMLGLSVGAVVNTLYIKRAKVSRKRVKAVLAEKKSVSD